jgi:hypothetical protein
MSEEKQEVPVLSLLEQMRQQHANFVSQKEFAQNNLNQLLGAIFACDLMIKKFEDEEVKKELPKEDEKEELSDAA